MSEELSHLEQRKANLEAIREKGYDPYPASFPITHPASVLVARYSDVSAEELEKFQHGVITAGRLLAIRGHGKASFCHILGDGVRLQVYVRQDRVGEENYEIYQLCDVGDVVGVEGVMFRTRTGELTVFADRVHFLAKALLPPPEKWHGLSNVETRYRQRYLDLISNSEVREIFLRRSRLISEIRRFLEEEENYLEVETPMMQPIAGGAMARPFETFHEALGIPLYLRIAPELYLKRLTVGGLDRVFEINRNFRNEGISTQHNPEFTMLEFYQAYSDYEDLIELTERMLKRVVPAVTGSLLVPYQDDELDFSSYQRMTMREAIVRFWDFGDHIIGRLRKLHSKELLDDRDVVLKLLKSVAKDKVDENLSWGKLLALLFEEVAEDKLVQPTFITEFPVEVSPLSKRNREDDRFVDRFELIVAGMEIANGFSELNDPEEQKERFEEQLKRREAGDREAHRMDEDYITALRYGMPPTAGEGIGIDRLTMVLTDSPSIREVILFPLLRPLETDDSEV